MLDHALRFVWCGGMSHQQTAAVCHRTKLREKIFTSHFQDRMKIHDRCGFTLRENGDGSNGDGPTSSNAKPINLPEPPAKKRVQLMPRPIEANPVFGSPDLHQVSISNAVRQFAAAVAIRVEVMKAEQPF